MGNFKTINKHRALDMALHGGEDMNIARSLEVAVFRFVKTEISLDRKVKLFSSNF